jgi:hypothetical protein
MGSIACNQGYQGPDHGLISHRITVRYLVLLDVREVTKIRDVRAATIVVREGQEGVDSLGQRDTLRHA